MPSHGSREDGTKRKSGSLSYRGPGWSCPVSQSEPIRLAKSIPAVDGGSHTGGVFKWLTQLCFLSSGHTLSEDCKLRSPDTLGAP